MTPGPVNIPDSERQILNRLLTGADAIRRGSRQLPPGPIDRETVVAILDVARHLADRLADDESLLIFGEPDPLDPGAPRMTGAQYLEDMIFGALRCWY